MGPHLDSLPAHAGRQAARQVSAVPHQLARLHPSDAGQQQRCSSDHTVHQVLTSVGHLENILSAHFLSTSTSVACLAALGVHPELRQLRTCRHMALWRAQVVESEVLGRPRGWAAGQAPSMPGAVGPILRLLVGDGSGARAELLVPHRPE